MHKSELIYTKKRIYKKTTPDVNPSPSSEELKMVNEVTLNAQRIELRVFDIDFGPICDAQVGVWDASKPITLESALLNAPTDKDGIVVMHHVCESGTELFIRTRGMWNGVLPFTTELNYITTGKNCRIDLPAHFGSI